ncbi:MAG: Hsp70 family protein [Phycisphaerae bacterium]
MTGFDIGTTQCKVGRVDPTGKASIINNARGEPTTPSAIYLAELGEPLIGTDAVEQGFVDPARYVSNFKLKLGTTESLVAGTSFMPTDATATLIAALKKDAENVLGIEITEAIATCPANFRDDAKQALLEAFERNGITIPLLLAEPSAAGMAYGVDKPGGGKTLLVYDFGGGTFDVSVLRVDGSQITVLATEGVARLGGNDINECLRQRVLEEVAAACGEMPTPQSDPLFFPDLAQRVEAAKISLGNRPEVPIVAGYKGRQVIVKVTRDEFHKAIAPLVQQSLDALDRAVARAGRKKQQIDRLLMVGGTSRLPVIQDKVADHTGLVPRTDIDPEKAVAYGAALASVTEMARQGRTATLRGQVIPSPDVFMRDVSAHDVGCCVVDTSSAKERLANAVIIPKNTPIPCQRTDRFYLQYEDQTAVQIEILQGEADADRDDCLLIGEFVLENLPHESKRTERIQVEYAIDANGMVTATGTDLVSGRQHTVSVDYKKGVRVQPSVMVQTGSGGSWPVAR